MRKYSRRRRSTIGKRKRRLRSRSRTFRRRAPKIRAENKWFPTNYGQTLQVAPSLVVMNAMPQGTGIGERIGNKVVGTGLHLNGFVLNVSAASQLCRIVLFKWLQINPPSAVTDVLETNSITATYDPDQVNVKYKILSDFTIRLAPAGQDGAIKRWKVGKKLKNYVQYQGINAADWTKNVIYMMVYPSSANAIELQYDCVYRYVDS